MDNPRKEKGYFLEVEPLGPWPNPPDDNVSEEETLEKGHLKFNNHIEENTIIIKPIGRIEAATTHEFSNSVKLAVKDNEKNILLDLSEVDYISSVGLRKILEIYNTLCKDYRHMAIVINTNMLLEFFDVVNFGKNLGNIIPIYHNHYEALDALESMK